MIACSVQVITMVVLNSGVTIGFIADDGGLESSCKFAFIKFQARRCNVCGFFTGEAAHEKHDK